MPPAGFEHGFVGVRVSTPLANYVQSKRLGVVVIGDTGFRIAQDPDTVRAPDVAFVSLERVERYGIPKKYWLGPPDLAVEVVSPSDTVYEVDEKVLEWLEAGSRLVWVVNPRRRTVTVHAPNARPVILSEGETLEGQDVIPGFRIGVAELFVPT